MSHCSELDLLIDISLVYHFKIHITSILILAGKSVLKRKREHFSIYKTCSDRNFCHLQLINVQSVTSKKKNANYASNNGMYIKRDKL